MSQAVSQAAPAADADRDGLNDAMEDALLQRFAPQFMISSDDCSAEPARFLTGIAIPTVAADDGTIYGQALPHKTAGHAQAEVELHYYHLWRTDCGRMGHALDAEHVSVLLELEDGAMPDDAKRWRARYWYAASHEDTVCDASQITRAATLKAEDHGAKIWISSGKHASFLTEAMCHHGCGGDRCVHSRELAAAPVVNVGEWDAPLHGAVWVSSPRWPLKEKMERSDFLAARTDRLERLPGTDIAWANPAKRPAQAAILGGNSAVDGVLTGGRSTDTALAVAGGKTGSALGTSTRKTGHALAMSVRAVRKALGANAPASTTH